MAGIFAEASWVICEDIKRGSKIREGEEGWKGRTEAQKMLDPSSKNEKRMLKHFDTDLTTKLRANILHST